MQDRARAAFNRIVRGCTQLRLDRPSMRASELVADVHIIDEYLTKKTSGRNLVYDMRYAEECCVGELWLVYLSDGGYTRLVIDPISEGQTIRLTGGPSASWDECLKRFKSIGGRFWV